MISKFIECEANCTIEALRGKVDFDKVRKIKQYQSVLIIVGPKVIQDSIFLPQQIGKQDDDLERKKMLKFIHMAQL